MLLSKYMIFRSLIWGQLEFSTKITQFMDFNFDFAEYFSDKCLTNWWNSLNWCVFLVSSSFIVHPCYFRFVHVTFDVLLPTCPYVTIWKNRSYDMRYGLYSVNAVFIEGNCDWQFVRDASAVERNTMTFTQMSRLFIRNNKWLSLI